jgi:hypothetical protein
MFIQVCFSLRRQVPVTLALVAVLGGSAVAAVPAAAAGRMTITSPAFANGATTPDWSAHRGCVPGAEDRSPALMWPGRHRARRASP